MSLYSIHRRCGHVERVPIYGTNVRGQRERQAERERGFLCAECAERNRDERRAREAVAAREAATWAGLPELTGTPKQVDWALRIRAEVSATIDRWLAHTGRQLAERPERLALTDRFAAGLAAALRSETTAAWWIEHRTQAAEILRLRVVAELEENPPS